MDRRNSKSDFRSWIPSVLVSLITCLAIAGCGVAESQEASATSSPSPLATQSPPTFPTLTNCARAIAVKNWNVARPVDFGDVSVTLPEGVGDFNVGFIIREPGPNPIYICYVGAWSGIAINATTGEETGRDVSDPNTNAILDSIVAGVHVHGRATQQAALTSGRFVPPPAGDAGLAP
jgi:hypothetical protein